MNWQINVYRYVRNVGTISLSD